jgi:hypothetical protein
MELDHNSVSSVGDVTQFTSGFCHERTPKDLQSQYTKLCLNTEEKKYPTELPPEFVEEYCI